MVQTQTLSLGRYVVTELLATGGTAEIFKAKLIGIEGFEKPVVIKRILPHWSSNPHFISMLIDEANIMVRLNHERIVQVYELGKEDETYYLAMEYVSGTDLRNLSEQAKKMGTSLSPKESLLIIGEVLRGLHYIHKQTDEKGQKLKIVHRDISPQNILISTEGAVKITDFGIAHAASRSYETATGVLKGKFSYMSPEQARGGIIDERTDIFATGIILYELLTQQRLFLGHSDLEILEKVRFFDAKESLKNAKIDPRLKSLLLKALHANPKERYPNAYDFLKDLNECRQQLSLHCDAHLLSKRLQEISAQNFSLSQNNDTLLKTQAIQTISSTAIVLREEFFEDTFSREEEEVTHPFPEFSALLLKTQKIKKVFPRFHPLQSLRNSRLLYRLLTLVQSANVSWRTMFVGDLQKCAQTVLGISEYKTGGIRKKIFNKLYWLGPSILFAVGLFLYFYQAPEKKPPTVSLKAEAAQNPEPIPVAAAPVNPPAKAVESEPSSPEENGLLSIHASPWGKISIAGIISGSERPVLKKLPFGNYQVTATFQDTSGGFKSISRNIKISKASTHCVASFGPDGNNAIQCK